MNGKSTPQGMQPLAPNASEAPAANYSFSNSSSALADRRSDPTAQLAMPEDLKMPTDIDITAPQVPSGLGDPAGEKR
jgi:hypothetical protein